MTAEAEAVESKPDISKAVARGDLASVQKIVDSAAAISSEEKTNVVNHARRWTERNIAYISEENPNGVAEWFDVTPVTLASMRGHDAIVEYLLQQGADPTLKGCSFDDVIMELSNNDDHTNRVLVDLPELHMNAFDAASKLTNKIRCCRRTRDLLMVVKVKRKKRFTSLSRRVWKHSLPLTTTQWSFEHDILSTAKIALLEKNNIFG